MDRSITLRSIASFCLLASLTYGTAQSPTVARQWKRQLLEGGAEVFNQNGNKEQREQQAVQTELYEQIGRLKMELEWVKKKSAQFT